MSFHLEYIKLCYVYSKLSSKPAIKDITSNTGPSISRKYPSSFYILPFFFFFNYVLLPNQVLEARSSHHEYNEKHHQIDKTHLIATIKITRWGGRRTKIKIHTYIK